MNILDRISPRMRRWLKRVGIALAALVVLAAYELARDRQIRTDSVANWVR